MSRSTIAGSRSAAGPYPPPPGVLTAIQSPGGQHVTFALREMRRGRNHAGLTDGNLVHCAGAAAEQARRPDAPMIHQERGFGLAAQQPDLVVDPEPAAMPPRAPRAFAQREAVEQDRVMLLENFDGLGLRDPDARAAVG